VPLVCLLAAESLDPSAGVMTPAEAHAPVPPTETELAQAFDRYLVAIERLIEATHTDPPTIVRSHHEAFFEEPALVSTVWQRSGVPSR